MLRKKAVALALSMLIPAVASALGLGALKTTSGLNQPFDGRIEILGATAADYDTLVVKLADAQSFERAGVLREAVLLSLKFEVVETPVGNDFIRVSSRDPVREPFLNFLLELNWANGRMVREYTVLLDPPLYDRNRRAAAPTYTPAPVAQGRAAPVRAQAAPRRTPAAPPVAAGGELDTVTSSDTAWSLALRYRPDAGVSVQRMMIALLRANPAAFSNGNINLLRRGAVLRMPSQADIDGLSQGEALAEVTRQHQLWEEYRHGATAAPPAQPMGETPTPTGGEPAAPGDALDAALADAAKAKSEADARLELVAPQADQTPGGSPGGSSAEPATPSPGVGGDDAAALTAEGETTQAAADAELKSKLDEASEIIDLLQRQVEIKDEELARLQARLAELGAAQVPGAAAPAAPVTPPESAETPATPTPAAPEAEVAHETPAKPAPPAAAPPTGPLDALIPASLRDMVPGGAVTIIGVLGSVLLLLLVMLGKSLAGRRGKEIKAGPKPKAATVAVAAPAAAGIVTAADVDDVPIASAAPDPEAAADQFTRTLEATSEQLQGDPLEEVNVYLAYERFDQAEELVKKVIAQYPNEHKYKLRLLEIYYSANDKQAYEMHARDLLDAVGDHHPLWENAVAMWTEMSPQRALFAPGPSGPDGPAAGASSKEVVDVTGEATSPGGGTMTMGPGEDGPLAVTAVGLTNDYTSGNESVLDFDLTSSVGDAELEPMLDLTTGEPGDTGGMIDLTSTVEQLEKSGFLDLTGGLPDEATGPAATESTDLAFEADADSDTSDLNLDVSAARESDLSDTADTGDLLDITKTSGVEGRLELDNDEPLLSITAGALADTASDAGMSPAADADDALNLDFDISDTVAPRIESGDGPDLAGEETDASAGRTADDPLDFDIDNLGLDLDLDVEAPVPTTAESDDEFDLTAESDGFSLDLDAESGAALDLSLQNPDPEASFADGLASTHDGIRANDDDSDIEFDLALQDTTDFSKLDVDDTLELPKSSTNRPTNEPLAESLEDLTRSMEASLAGLDLDEEPVDEGMLDLDLGQLGADGLDLDFSLDDVPVNKDLDTLALDHEDLSLERTGMHIDKTVVMPRGDDVEYQSEADEVDTKLNLAKAYIELGDSDGARAILDEVAREGTTGQQQEAQHLLAQLA